MAAEVDAAAPPPAPLLVFDNIIQQTEGQVSGQFTLFSDNLSYKTTQSKPKVFKKEAITAVNYLRCSNRCMLEVHLDQQDDQSFERFDNFSKRDLDSLINAFKADYSIEPQEVKLSTYGITAGELDLHNDRGTISLSFRGDRVFEVPYHLISQCAMPGKNEIEIQFDDDDTAAKEDEMLVQMRLHLPLTEHDLDPSEEVQNTIVERAGIKGVAGDVIVSLSESIGTFMTPRGKYLLELYDKYLRMHGKTYNYKITYRSISRMFLLPNVYGTCFVISLHQPIQQGQQRYAHLVMNLQDREETITVNASEEDLANKYAGQLTAELRGRLPETVARVFKALSGKKVFIPGDFVSAHNIKCIKCSLKASSGFLYPLQRSLFFIHKPATFIRFEDIDYIEFHRLDADDASKSAVNRSFDMDVVCKPIASEVNLAEASNAFDQGEKLSFANIDKSEYANLYTFLKSKKINIKNRAVAESSLQTMGSAAPAISGGAGEKAEAVDVAAGFGEDSESDDSDFGDEESDSSSSDEESDAEEKSGDDEEDEEEASAKSEGEEEEVEVKTSKKRKAEEAEKDEGNKKKKKAKKDPKLPKRALGAFNYYVKEHSAVEREANPGMPASEVMKKVSEKWKAITEDGKKKYQALAEEDKGRYEKEMKEYKPSEGFDKKGNAL